MFSAAQNEFFAVSSWGKIVFEPFACTFGYFSGTAKLMKFQQWCSFAYSKTFTFLNLEQGADLARSRLVLLDYNCITIFIHLSLRFIFTSYPEGAQLS